MPKKRYYQSAKGGSKKRHEDSYFLREDQSQVANLPQQVIMREYPKTNTIETPYLDDTARGVDIQLNADVKESKRKKSPEKY